MKERLKYLVAKGNTETVIETLLSATREDPRAFNEIAILSNRFAQHIRDARMGMYAPAEQNRGLAQINNSLLDFIDRLDEATLVKAALEGVKDSGPGHEPAKSRGSNKLLFMIVGALLIAITGFFALKAAYREGPDRSEIDNIIDQDAGQEEAKREQEHADLPGPSGKEQGASGSTSEKKEGAHPDVPPPNPVDEKEKGRKNSLAYLVGNTQRIEGANIEPYSIGVYEVTVGQYWLFCETAGHPFPKEVDTTNAMALPITYVSWNDAMAYCGHINARLPTVEEWEFAASGGEKGQGSLYSGGNDAGSVAWSGLRSGPMPVGKKQKNELSLYDMSGNVREWCSSPAEGKPGYYKAKGGGWKSYKAELEIKEDAVYEAGFRNSSLGFRIARD